jgi:hypothetical protein
MHDFTFTHGSNLFDDSGGPHGHSSGTGYGVLHRKRSGTGHVFDLKRERNGGTGHGGSA